jgi:hypothetical protein
MPTVFPGAIDDFSNPTADDYLDSDNPALLHADQHTNANDAIEAIERYLRNLPGGSNWTITSHVIETHGISKVRRLEPKTKSYPQTTLQLQFQQYFGVPIMPVVMYFEVQNVNERIRVGDIKLEGAFARSPYDYPEQNILNSTITLLDPDGDEIATNTMYEGKFGSYLDITVTAQGTYTVLWERVVPTSNNLEIDMNVVVVLGEQEHDALILDEHKLMVKSNVGGPAPLESGWNLNYKSSTIRYLPYTKYKTDYFLNPFTSRLGTSINTFYPAQVGNLPAYSGVSVFSYNYDWGATPFAIESAAKGNLTILGDFEEIASSAWSNNTTMAFAVVGIVAANVVPAGFQPTTNILGFSLVKFNRVAGAWVVGSEIGFGDEGNPLFTLPSPTLENYSETMAVCYDKGIVVAWQTSVHYCLSLVGLDLVEIASCRVELSDIQTSDKQPPLLCKTWRDTVEGELYVLIGNTLIAHNINVGVDYLPVAWKRTINPGGNYGNVEYNSITYERSTGDITLAGTCYDYSTGHRVGIIISINQDNNFQEVAIVTNDEGESCVQFALTPSNNNAGNSHNQLLILSKWTKTETINISEVYVSSNGYTLMDPLRVVEDFTLRQVHDNVINKKNPTMLGSGGRLTKTNNGNGWLQDDGSGAWAGGTYGDGANSFGGTDNLKKFTMVDYDVNGTSVVHQVEFTDNLTEMKNFVGVTSTDGVWTLKNGALRIQSNNDFTSANPTLVFSDAYSQLYSTFHIRNSEILVADILDMKDGIYHGAPDARQVASTVVGGLTHLHDLRLTPGSRQTPLTEFGAPGDKEGDIRLDDDWIYVCIRDYDVGPNNTGFNYSTFTDAIIPGPSGTVPIWKRARMVWGRSDVYYRNQSVPILPISSAGGYFQIDASSGNSFSINLTENTYVDNPTYLVDGTALTFYFIQDSTGGRTITTWGSVFAFSKGIAPTLSTAPNAVDIMTGTYHAALGKLSCNLLPDFK